MTATIARKLTRKLIPLALIAIGGLAWGQATTPPPPNWGAPGAPVGSAPVTTQPLHTLTPVGAPGSSTAGATALPAGAYHLTMTFTSPSKTVSDNVQLTRNGSQISLTLGVGAVMTGTVAANGAVTLTLNQAGTQLKFTGQASGHSGSGQVTASSSGHSATGTFTLGAPTPSAHMTNESEDRCGMWCQLMQIIHCIASAGTDCG